jgi:arylsulfatase A-like enzyme
MKFWRAYFSVLLLAISVGAADSTRPNILLILADDMGFSDIGCYGGEIDTPNLNKLAANGLRFTQFYNTARCCPTRASLLTGLYPHQAGVPHMVDNMRLPLEERQLSRRAVTIAEALRAGGYHTAMSGKWHVCPPESFSTNGPMARGFEHFYGLLHGAASYWAPVAWVRDHQVFTNTPPNFFLTDAIAENAVNYVRDYAKESKPFFIYTAFTAPHWPLHAPEADIQKYVERYKRGWDVLRPERYKRQIEMGLIDKDTPLSPRDTEARPWSEVVNVDWQARRMAVYAAQIERLDRGIGKILDALRETGAYENTLIFFLSDNGGCAEVLGANQKNAHVPLHAPDGGPMRLGNSANIMPGPADTYASYGLPWANLSNTPFRTYKHWVHEGGISAPFIVHWPARIKQSGLRRDPAHLIDIMATCLDVSKTTYPQTFAGQPIQPLEGVSLEPAFRDQPLAERAIYFEHESNRAVHMGNWKLVSRYPEGWELYDLTHDRSELKNLADKESDRVAKMSALYDQWAKRANVPPPDQVALKPAAAKKE